MNDYILCYPAGSGGRFLSAALYHITNNLDKPMLITEENSGHSNKTLSGFCHAESISQNHGDVFKYLSKVNFSHPTVFVTHAFPPYNLFTMSNVFNTSKLICISYEEDDCIELQKNKIYKSTLPQIIQILEFGIEPYLKKLHYDISTYVVKNFEKKYGYSITMTNIHIPDTLKDIFKLAAHRHTIDFVQYQFKYPLPIEDNDRVLTLKYKDIFEKTETSYVALDKLSKFTGSEILSNVLSSYHQYVEGQKRLMQELSYL